MLAFTVGFCLSPTSTICCGAVEPGPEVDHRLTPHPQGAEALPASYEDFCYSLPLTSVRGEHPSGAFLHCDGLLCVCNRGTRYRGAQRRRPSSHPADSVSDGRKTRAYVPGGRLVTGVGLEWPFHTRRRDDASLPRRQLFFFWSAGLPSSHTFRHCVFRSNT